MTGGTTNPKVGTRSSLLAGVKVLDLTNSLAGPFGTTVLADMGADVVKLEPPHGDRTRQTPPYFVGDDSAYFISLNRNKRSIAMDLKTAEGQQVLEKLLLWADVVVDNLRQQKREDVGLGFERISEINPALVSCSVTGFGSEGPYSDRPAYDIVVEALAGVMSLTGPEGGPSVRAGVPIGDIVAGLYLTIGVLGGLQHRNSTGRGRHIDISMLDSQISLLSYLAQYFLTGGDVPTHQGRAHVSSVTYNAFETADGEIVIAAETERMFAALCRTLGLAHLATDERFSSRAARLKNKVTLEAALTDAFLRRDTNEVYLALVEAEVPCAPINSVDAALQDPQVLDREMVVTLPHRSGREIDVLGPVVKVDDDTSSEFFSPPGLGAHADAILAEVGFSGAEIAQMRAAGAFSRRGSEAP